MTGDDKSGGWISLYRKIREHWIWQDPIKFQRWIDLLLEVNHSGKKVNIGSVLIECERGQTVRSLSNWAKRWKCSKSSARRFLELLENDHMIVSESVSKTTRITVCNYDDYQNNRNDDEPIVNRLRTDDEPIADPNNNENNENKEIISTNVDIPESEKQASRTQIDYEKLIEIFNSETKGVFGEVRYPISSKRQESIRARVREHGKEAFIEMIRKASASDFLKGNNARGFQASFDWLIKPSNFQKTIEGNYDNRSKENKRGNTEIERMEWLAREAEEAFGTDQPPEPNEKKKDIPF